MQKIGIFSIHGDVEEHRDALIRASSACGERMACVLVKDAKGCEGLDGLVIPGGESTAFSYLMDDAFRQAIRVVPRIFGTCAGLILIAKSVADATPRQKPLGLLDAEVRRNAYGSQADSFEARIETKFGAVNGVFIRAPGIENLGPGVETIAELNGKPVGVLQQGKQKIMGTAFHPELSTTKFHEYFLKM